jgi:hypothetical protein
MKTNLSSIMLALVAISSSAPAATPEEKGHVLRTIKWSDVQLPAGAEVQNKPGASPTLLVKHDGAKVLQLPLWKLEKPGITRKCYALSGKVRYKDVAGLGYLEMWNVFPVEKGGGPDQSYFSRTMAPTGPMANITGSSDWRPVLIPFDGTQSPTLPKTLDLNLHLPGSGEVEITSLVLIEFDDAQAMWGSVTTAEASPRLPHEAFTKYIAAAWVIGGLAVAGVAAWVVSRKMRQDSEERRMKAMDALP